MRKQTARIALSAAVLPTTVIALHGYTANNSSVSHSGDTNGVPASTASGIGGASHTNKYRLADFSSPVGTPTDPSPTWVGQVGAALNAASSQVIAKGQTIETQNAQYQAQLERERNAASYQSHVSSSGGSTAHAVAVPPGVSSVLACIRQYESGDNYSDTSNPYYRGAYQFSWSTWQSVGGSGDPASASASEQDMRAQLLVSRSGWGAWSTASLCGV